MKILELKNAISKIKKKKSLGKNQKHHRGDKELLNLKIAQWTFSMLNNREKKWRKKIGLRLRDLGNIDKILTFMSLDSQEEKGYGAETVFEEILSENFPKLVNNINL